MFSVDSTGPTSHCGRSTPILTAVELEETKNCNRAGVRRDSNTVTGLVLRRNVGLGSPTNSQPGRLRYVAQASGLRVLAASSRQFSGTFGMRQVVMPRRQVRGNAHRL